MAKKKIIIPVKLDTEEAEKGVDKIGDSLDKTKGKAQGTSESFKTMGGSAAGAFSTMLAGLKSVATGFKSLGSAILLSGIGALVITLIAVKKAFTSSEAGQNKFAKLMGIIGTVTGNVVDLLADFGESVINAFENPKEAILSFIELLKENVINRFEGLLELIPNLGKAIKLLFSGDFAEAGKVAIDSLAKITLGVEDMTDKINSATEALKEFGEEQLREAKIAAGIADQRAEADRIERGLIVERAKAQRDIAELRDIAARRDLHGLETRKEALKEALVINENIINKEIIAAQLRASAIIKENKLSKSNKDALKAEEEAKALVIQLETQKLNLAKRIGTELSALNLQAEQERKKEIDSIQKQVEAQIAADQVEDDKEELKIQAKEDRQQRLFNHFEALRVEEKKKLEEQAKFEENLDRKKTKMSFDLASQGVNAITSLMTEGSEAAKGLALAQVTFDTFRGIQATFASAAANPASILFPAQPFIQAGFAATFGFAQIKNILATKPASKGSSTSAPTISRPPLPPTQASQNGLNTDSLFSTGNISGGQSDISQDGIGSNQVVKAVVIESDITDSQQLAASYQNKAQID